MKNFTRRLTLLVALMLLTSLFAGQSALAKSVVIKPAPVVIGANASFVIPVPAAPGVAVKKNDKAEIDYSNAKDGYVMIKALQEKAFKVRITGPSGVNYDYDLKKGNHNIFPFTDGNGAYKVMVIEPVGDKYALANSADVQVTLADEFAPYIRPNQLVNYNKDSKIVAKAAELTKDTKDVFEDVTNVYNFVVKNFTYDKDRAATVKAGYIPDVDDVLAKSKGICYDYSAVMVGMLRSQGIPTKMIFGFVGETYHAWISVWSKDTGWVSDIIQFSGNSWKLLDPTFASTGGSKYTGDGINYTIKFSY